MDFLHVSSSSNNLDHENCDSVWDIKMQTGKRPTATLCQPTHNVGRILTLIYGVEKGKKSSSRIDPCFGITRLPRQIPSCVSQSHWPEKYYDSPLLLLRKLITSCQFCSLISWKSRHKRRTTRSLTALEMLIKVCSKIVPLALPPQMKL